MTFIDIGTVWVIAEMKEKSLAHVQAEDKAELVLDSSPGSIFPAKVKTVGWGVSVGSGQNKNGLPTINEENEWLRSPQRGERSRSRAFLRDRQTWARHRANLSRQASRWE